MKSPSLSALVFAALILCGAFTLSPAYAGQRRSHKKTRYAGHNPKQLKGRLQAVRRKKEQLKRELRRARMAAVEVKEELHTVDNRLETLENDLETTTSKLADNQQEQRELGKQLDSTTLRRDQVREQVRKRIRITYLRGSGSIVSALIGSRSVTDLVSREQILQAVVRRDHRMFEEYRRLTEDIRQRKIRQDQLVGQIRSLKQRQVRHQADLKDTREDKTALLGSLQVRQSQLKKLIAQFDADDADISAQIAAFARRPRPTGSKPLPQVTGRLLIPVNGRFSSPFGMRYHPILHYVRMHAGQDISAPTGAPIYAAADGEVISARYSSSYGNVIILAHGGGMTTIYAHCSRIMVRQGESVRRGQRIGSVGSTGLASGPHLHWEVRINGRAVNPVGR